MEMTLNDPAIEALQRFFGGVTLSSDRVLLSPGTTITDMALFLKSQFTILRDSGDQVARGLAFERLNRLKTVLENK